MTTSSWMKSPNVLILPRFGSEGLRLEQQRTGSTVLLDSKQAKLKLWSKWPENAPLTVMKELMIDLEAGGFILPVSELFVTDIPESRKIFTRPRNTYVLHITQGYTSPSESRALVEAELFSAMHVLRLLTVHYWSGVKQKSGRFFHPEQSRRI